MKIGFIGLGNMGAPMAANLAGSGHDVTGFDTMEVTVRDVVNASSATEAVKGADVVITMLPNGEILRAVAAEIIPAMEYGAGFVDCSTVDVDSARAVAGDATHAGLHPVDAPVSGGIGGASAGTLTFMAGGSEEAFEKAEPLFEIMGQKAVHCGDSGAGQAAKICNNMILAYCPAPGIGPQSPADNDYQPGFAAELMLKDLRLSQQAADASDAATPLGQHATDLYEQFVEMEDGLGKDFSAMLPRFEKKGRGE